jgi:YbbR domain-containing protein
VKNLLLWPWRLITHNFAWKLLAFAIAISIWVFVASEPELATFASVPLAYKNLSGDLEISSSLLESIYLELRGPSGELRSLSDVRRPAVILDMTGVQPGERTFSIGDGNVRLPRGIRLIRAIPSQVRFDIERRASLSVPVKVRFIPEHPSGYEVSHVEVTPAYLPVIGPQSHIARVAAATTDPIDLSGVEGRSEFHVNAFIEDAYVRFRTSPAVVVTVTMKKK